MELYEKERRNINKCADQIFLFRFLHESPIVLFHQEDNPRKRSLFTEKILRYYLLFTSKQKSLLFFEKAFHYGRKITSSE